MTIGVGILAGGRGKRLMQSEPKAFVILDGRPIWAYSCEAALEVADRDVQMVLPTHRQVPHGRIQCLDTRHSYLGDLFQLLEHAKSYERYLIINADLVLTTANSLRTFLGMTSGSEAGFIWPAIRRSSIPGCLRQTVLNDLPGRPDLIRSGVMQVRSAFLNLDDKIVRKMEDPGINGVYSSDFVSRIRGAIKRAEMEFYRRYAELPLLGFVNCAKWALKLLSMEEVMKCMGRFLGCEKVEMPECDIWPFGFDVDLPRELELADHYLRSERELGRVLGRV